MSNEIKFVDLNSLYKYSEDNANYVDSLKIADLLRELREQKVKENKPDEAEKAQ